MDIDTAIALTSAVVASISAATTFWFSVLASKSAALAGKVAMGQSEISIRDSITATRTRVEDIAQDLEEFLAGRRPNQLNAAESRQLESFKKRNMSATENFLNAYENGCGLYIDGKVDRDRFKKSYRREIQNICEAKAENPIHSFMNPADISNFRAIWKVYREWFQAE